MSVIARATDASDAELVASVRAGDDSAFEELYRRYSRRVAGFVCRMVGDPDRAEDVTQEAFFSALRRLRKTDADIVFKPWVFEIAKNAAIDHFRRTSRAEEVSLHADDGSLRPADHLRLVGVGPLPDIAYEGKERLDHLRGAFDELSASHARILVLRELEGLSYREIGERMAMTRPAVESTLFRARRRLNEEYAELDTGARCLAVTAAIARLAEGLESPRDRRRVGRHAIRCSACRRHARELGVSIERPVRSRVAALLPLPVLARRRRGDSHEGGGGAAAGNGYAMGVERMASWAPAMVTTGAAEGTAHAWGKLIAVVAAVALAGGGAAVHERIIDTERGTESRAVPAQPGPDAGAPSAPAAGQPGTGGVQPGAAGPGAPQRGQAGSGAADGAQGVRAPQVGGGSPEVGSPQVGSPQVGVPDVDPPAAAAPDLPSAPPVDAPSTPEGDLPSFEFNAPSTDSVGEGMSLLDALGSQEAPSAPSAPDAGRIAPPALPPAQQPALDAGPAVQPPPLSLPEG